MGARRDLARDRIGRIDPQRLGTRRIGAERIAMREHEPRHPIGQRRLADAGRPPDQPGMRNPPAAIGIQQSQLGVAMPEQRGRLARMNRRYLRFDLTGAHAELARLPALALKKRSRKAAHMFAATIRGLGGGVDQHAALRFAGCDLPVRLAQFLMKFDVFRLEPVGRAGAAAGGRALHADFDGDIENDGQIRLEVADGDPLHRVEHGGRDLAQAALIGACRIRKPVAQHPCSLTERGLDDRAHVVVARGRKQQRLGVRAQQLAHARQHEMPDDFGARRSAGFAGDDGAQPGGAQALRQRPDLRGFAGSLTAFKGDE